MMVTQQNLKVKMWNNVYPIGTKVYIKTEGVRTKTTSQAYYIHKRARVTVVGYGSILLDDIQVI